MPIAGCARRITIRASRGCFARVATFRRYGSAPSRNVQVIGLTWTEHNSRLLALPGSAIEFAADLRGKRLALLRRPVRAG